MRFLVTMNMGSASGMLTHQLTLDHPVNSEEELCAILNRQEFIVFHLFYRRKNMGGDVWWQDRGKVIINSSCIGKVQEFLDMEQEEIQEDGSRGPSSMRNPPRGPVRPGPRSY